MRSNNLVINGNNIRIDERSDIVKSNGLAPTNYFARKVLMTGGYVNNVNGTYDRTADYGYSVALTAIRNGTSSLSNRVLTKYDDKLNQYDSLFETWYERQQALDLVTDSAKKILRFVTNWRKKAYWAKMLKDPSSVPEAWLTYQFGIKPLIGSYDSALRLLDRNVMDYNVRAASRASFSTPDNSIVGSRILIYGATISPKDSSSYKFAIATGLNQPFSSAFSVIPWGWAIDYFTNASQMLSNLEWKHPGIQERYVFESEKIEFTHTRPSDKYHDVLITSGEFFRRSVRSPKAWRYHWEFKRPLFGSNQAANLSSAIALTLKGAK